MSSEPLLSIRDLQVEYRNSRRSGFAVNRLSLDIAAGETLAVVGESGCGKSTTALAVMGLLPRGSTVGGRLLFDGADLLTLPERHRRALRGRDIGMIFQEPMTSLNPVYTIGRQIAEVLRAHERISRSAARSRVLELLDLVAIPEPEIRIDFFPHELSGGQRQRAMIAIAIALHPRLLIADEPTSALDSTVQAQILELLDGLRRDLSMSILLISHDVPLVSHWADRVVVMHHGEHLETLDARTFFEEARHPYTRGLIGASVRLSDRRHYTAGPLSEIHGASANSGSFAFEINQQPHPCQPRPAKTSVPLLSVHELVVDHGDSVDAVRAVDRASFDIAIGETLGLVGESGSGKSSLSRAIMRLSPIAGGTICFDGQDITHLAGAALRQQRRNVQLIFQDPYSSLNPRQAVDEILQGALFAHGNSDRVANDKKIARILDRVRLPGNAVDRFPHEFSGGQRQRIAIARALILEPKLVICDEPVSALDVSVQAQILNLLVELKHDHDLSYLFISHDLAVVQYMSDRVMVMNEAKIVEINDHVNIWQKPQHAATRNLIAAVA